ncbi:MAG TPA: adenylate/guanylate cyclase domain-containing protein [Alphaproteobacteria bacterium]|nr:adenylate/guanylate cyclase domain-containing protein [Alphaproteobacteria bacterium]
MSDLAGTEASFARIREDRLKAMFRGEELANLRLFGWTRTGAAVALAAWLLTVYRGPHLREHLISCALYVALGWIYRLLLSRTRRFPWYAALFPCIDALLIVDNLLPIMPWNLTELPLPVLLRFGSYAILFVPLALAAFHYTPWRTLWNAVAVSLAWSAAVIYILMQPGAFSESNLAAIGAEDPRRLLAIILNPNFVDLAGFESDIFLLLLVGTMLSVVVWRTRALVRRQITLERNRAQLARYFSPNLIEELQEVKEPLGPGRTERVAVLFADIVDFTRTSERLPPERVMELLRSFDRRMARVVFAHHGTLDKYIGDAVMATFGTPRPGRSDALNALKTARAMIDELERWNAKRTARGAVPIRVGIGVHYGVAVLGDIGDERRLEFAVIGDAVNVASRIERLTRVLGSDILVSQDVVDAAREEAPVAAEAALAGFVADRPRKLRGRREPVALWSYRKALPAEAHAGAA